MVEPKFATSRQEVNRNVEERKTLTFACIVRIRTRVHLVERLLAHGGEIVVAEIDRQVRKDIEVAPQCQDLAGRNRLGTSGLINS